MMNAKIKYNFELTADAKEYKAPKAVRTYYECNGQKLRMYIGLYANQFSTGAYTFWGDIFVPDNGKALKVGYCRWEDRFPLPIFHMLDLTGGTQGTTYYGNQYLSITGKFKEIALKFKAAIEAGNIPVHRAIKKGSAVSPRPAIKPLGYQAAVKQPAVAKAVVQKAAPAKPVVKQVAKKTVYTVYTDGSCLGNPGKGGWAAVILQNGKKVKEISGGAASETNNRMELTAVIKALSVIPKGGEVELFSDSKYMQNAFTKGWLKNWKSNGWKTSNKKEVKNKDLWIQLDAVYSQHKVRFHWVKGHDGVEFNERCDELAKAAANAVQEVAASVKAEPAKEEPKQVPAEKSVESQLQEALSAIEAMKLKVAETEAKYSALKAENKASKEAPNKEVKEQPVEMAKPKEIKKAEKSSEVKEALSLDNIF